MFQIYEGDLEVLESNLPALLDSSLETCNDPITRKRWEAVKKVICDVRWNYGPPGVVKTEPATEDGEEWKNG